MDIPVESFADARSEVTVDAQKAALSRKVTK